MTTASTDPFAPVAARPSGGTGTPDRHVRRRRGGGGFFSTLVGVVGELLITVGVLLALFVVWQLWWTDVQGGREQAATITAMGWDIPEAAASEPDLRRDDPPVSDAPAEGELFGQLFVPRWDGQRQIPIAEGTDKRSVLDRAWAGHYPETVMPGDIGNFSLAAHRMTYGAPFHRVEELEVGDPLIVRVEEIWYVYRVTEMYPVLPHQVEVVAPVPGEPGAEPGDRLMTLTTCHPIGLNSLQERFIVHSELDYWLPVEDGIPPDLPAELATSADASGAPVDGADTTMLGGR
ncbi:class E sortase [Oerskovia flava]|uniref:class E sortase n=1 Tax=Oerskovia flava TaxID=2986422 RepID=UPI00223FFFFD|nr:class E sortase [Oerskovia sp. JB1-3-2]